MDGTHIKDKAAWLAFKKGVEERHRWIDDRVEPEPHRYPVVVVTHHHWDDRYRQSKVCFEFVYLDEFVSEMDRAVWHLYRLSGEGDDSLPKYLGEVIPSDQPGDAMAFLHVGSSAATHVEHPTVRFGKQGIRVSGTRHTGDPVLLLLTQLRIPDHEVEWLE